MSDDDEPVCPLPGMKEKCKPQCQEIFTHYKACTERIKAKGGECAVPTTMREAETRKLSP